MPALEGLSLQAADDKLRSVGPTRRRWVLVSVLGVLAVALAALVGWLVFRDNPADQKVSVPSVVGLQRPQAETKLRDQDLDVEVKTANDAEAPRNEVTFRAPPRRPCAPGKRVSVTSITPPQITCNRPDGDRPASKVEDVDHALIATPDKEAGPALA